MAITVTSTLTLIDTADSVGTWTSADPTLSAGAAYVDPKEGTDCVCLDVDVETLSAYVALPGAPLNVSNTHLWCWVLSLSGPTLETRQNGGIQFGIGDGTNEYHWYIGGRDNYQGDWQNFVTWTGRTPDRTVGGGNPLTAATRFYITWTNTVKSKATRNCFWDYPRFGNGPIIVTNGTSADPATFTQLVSASNAQSIGVARNLGGVTFLKGPIQIGTSSNANTYFQSRGDLVVWEEDRIADSFYYINVVDNASTSFSSSFIMGSQIGTGSDSIGAQGSIITTPTGSIRWEFRAVDSNIDTLHIFGSTFQSMNRVSIGTGSTKLSNPDVRLVGLTVSDLYSFTKNVTGSALFKSVAVNFASSSVIPDTTLYLHDTGSISGTEFTTVQGYGLSSTQSAATETYTVTNFDFSTANKYLTVWQNKTWNIVNPNWTPNVSSQDEIDFRSGTGTQVNERFTLNTNTVRTNGNPITGSYIYVYEGQTNLAIQASGSSDTSGSYSVDVLKRSFTSGAGVLITDSRGDFALKTYLYGFEPNAVAITLTSELDTFTTLLVDSNLNSPDSASAITAGTGIGVKDVGDNPNLLVEYENGLSLFSAGEVVTNLDNGNNTATIVELTSGDATSGHIFLSGSSGGTWSTSQRLTGSFGGAATSSATTAAQPFSWEVSGSGYDLQTIYDYLTAKISEPTPDPIFRNAIEWGEQYETLLMYAQGSDTYFTNYSPDRAEGVFIWGYGAGAISTMTDDNGVTFTPPTQYSLTLTGLVAGTEVRIYEYTGPITGTETELAGIENSGTSFTYNYQYGGSDVDVYVVIHKEDYVWQSLNLTLSNANNSIPISQQFDRNYDNPA